MVKKQVDNFAYVFPTLIRYVGLVTTLVLIGFCLAGFYVQASPGFVAAAAMIVYKNLDAAAKSIDVEEAKSDNEHSK